jgi:hypothetical protein
VILSTYVFTGAGVEEIKVQDGRSDRTSTDRILIYSPTESSAEMRKKLFSHLSRRKVLDSDDDDDER